MASLGNMLLWKTDKFERVGEAVKINIPREVAQLMTAAERAHAPTAQRYLSQTQAAVAVRLRDRTTGLCVVAVCVHVTWRYDQPDVQCAQIRAVVGALDRFCKPSDGAVLMAGDFNAAAGGTPHQLVWQGRTSAPFPAATDGAMVLGALQHPWALPLHFHSVYWTAAGSEPAFTNKTPDFTGCLDYIWVAQRAAAVGWSAPEVVSVVPVPSEAALGGPVPSAEQPSDHLPLAAVLAVRRVR
eukprot:TRINITY_DN1483_c0_g1_i10.p1 TRINITY_DN1483_c0_g1~~TRINITY_DN1483_c0_g1_i10.p1  ORF type:complete len:241 (+),score=55.00 TRINITY_DN1483_c0_g1_i10:417-1139(+)